MTPRDASRRSGRRAPETREARRRPDARAFLPAALEVLETPASPLGRATAMALCGFFALAVAWAFFGKVDVVAVARGDVVPVGGVKTVQALDPGVVRAIHVRDGQRVAAGAPLIELDPTESEADRDSLLRDRAEAAMEAARLAATLDGLAGGDVEWTPPPGADPALAASHGDRLRAELALHAARMAGFDAERARREADRDALAAELARRRATLPIAAEREAALRALEQNDHTPRSVWLEARARLVENRYDIDVLVHRVAEARAALDAARREAEIFAADARRRILAALQDATRRVEQGNIARRAAERRAERQTLRAPVAGTVQQLDVSTIGGVVRPAAVLLVIVPDTAEVEVRADVLNRDKGFVHAGQPAAVKLDAFPFTRYGHVAGVVRQISGDAVDDPERGDVYDARITLDAAVVRADGRARPLVPGMAATVEIKTGKRRVIDFLFSPLRQYRDEALRER